jgi:predicted nucleic acid-binding protein
LKIYLDNCCFNRPYDDQTQERIYLESLAKLHIQQLIIDKKMDFIWSFILEYENGNNPYNIRKENIRNFSFRCVEYVDIANEKEIVAVANDIITSGIKEKDALHLACSIFSSCDYFITTDDRILKFTTEKIKIINPMQFIIETEGNL